MQTPATSPLIHGTGIVLANAGLVGQLDSKVMKEEVVNMYTVHPIVLLCVEGARTLGGIARPRPSNTPSWGPMSRKKAREEKKWLRRLERTV